MLSFHGAVLVVISLASTVALTIAVVMLFKDRPWERKRTSTSAGSSAAKWVVAGVVGVLGIVWLSEVHNEDTLRILAAGLGLVLAARIFTTRNRH